MGGRRTISFLTLLSVFLDRNSICCTGMNNEKPILASEVTQDAETGWNWPKRPISLGWNGPRSVAYAYMLRLWVYGNLVFLLSLLVGQIRLKFFASLSTNRSFLFLIPFSVWHLYNKQPFSFSSAAYKPILFIAINLAPSIYQFWDWTVSSNNIEKWLMVFARIMLIVFRVFDIKTKYMVLNVVWNTFKLLFLFHII